MAPFDPLSCPAFAGQDCGAASEIRKTEETAHGQSPANRDHARPAPTIIPSGISKSSGPADLAENRRRCAAAW